jgi:precorrin-6x reductase
LNASKTEIKTKDTIAAKDNGNSGVLTEKVPAAARERINTTKLAISNINPTIFNLQPLTL